MPAYKIRERLIPHRVLTYLLYAPCDAVEWLEKAGEKKVRIYTGPMSRAMGMRIAQLREALFWLQDQDLIKKAAPERKRGTLVITLLPPTNLPKPASPVPKEEATESE